MTSQPKKRELEPQTRAGDARAPQDGSRPAQETGGIRKLWEEEIQALQSRVFSSVEAALDEIAARVLARLKIPNQLEDGDFIKELFRTDPELMAQLRRVLRISG